MTVAKDRALKRLQETREGKVVQDLEREGCIRVASHVPKDQPRLFRYVRAQQQIGAGHQGAIWAMRFSADGVLLATAGQDRLVRVWILSSHFQQMHEKLLQETHDPSFKTRSFASPGPNDVFHPQPLLELHGHTADVLDVCWAPSKDSHVRFRP
jgi:WD40 repeat protein